jgi:hypothetical protein
MAAGNYWHRFGQDHVDLCDVRSGYGASAKPSLAEMAALANIPVKIDAATAEFGNIESGLIYLPSHVRDFNNRDTVNVLVPGGPADTRMIPVEDVADRGSLVEPDRMVPPLLWLVSDDAGGVTGRRFVAKLWDANLPPEQAAQQAGAPVAWC